MASSRSVGYASRRIAHYGLAGLVMLFFMVGLAVITAVRRTNASFDVWRPRTETAKRTITPGSVELGVVVRALMTFADAAAEEMLGVFWKTHSE